jgi:metallophosphoesterase (TIGR00282 family)
VKILFIGDVVGEPGRRAVKTLLPVIHQQHAPDFVIANGENSAGGNGITPRIADELYAAGVDVITTGDHLWDQKEVIQLLAEESRFLRPLNYPPETPGRGSGLYTVMATAGRTGHSLNIGVLNVQGRTFMQPPLDNPFPAAREAVRTLREQTNIIFVDFHAEATSEKIAFTRYLDGQVSAVVGTHTHVQTADEQIFPGGTAYLSDAGFTGPHESVLGREIVPVIQRFLTSVPQRFEVAKDRVLLHGALIEVDEANGRAVKIERISLPL